MQHYRSLQQVNLRNTWLTIGTFDGVHTGHQRIIHHLVKGAHQSDALAVVVTFFPHPAVILGKREPPHYLTTPDERARLLGEIGVDVVITIPFNRKTMNQSPAEFLSVLKKRLGFNHLVVGYDFALGRDRRGDVRELERTCGELGYHLDVLQPIEIDGWTVSSSLVREALSKGDLEKVNRLLGRPYMMSGQVVHGDGRGRTIGIPTANLAYWEEQVLPKTGVYACKASIEGENWKSVVNVGFRPTFNDKVPSLHVEAHLIGYQGDLYSKDLSLSFISRLRDEQRFSGMNDLIRQIEYDIKQAVSRLAN
jgi:riboflavin kinase / FMN adenylyltransferase